MPLSPSATSSRAGSPRALSHWPRPTAESAPMALHFRGITPSPLQLVGDNNGLRAIMAQRLCPESAYVVARPEHVPVVEEFYDWDSPGLMLRMALRGEDFRGGGGDCVRLATSDLDGLTAFYACARVKRRLGQWAYWLCQPAR